MEMMLQTQNLCKYFKKQKAVNNVSLNIEKKQIYGLLGPNGAGKSTTLKMLTGMMKPTTGKINNEEHHYRMVEITNKETGNYNVMMISTGDSFTRVVNRGCPKDPTQLALNSQGMLSNTKDRNESKTFLSHRRRLPPLQVASKK